ncbi:FAD synthase [Thermococci archaeon]|nr:MAG: FAD synthase [Thermococci archaeon]RLF97157.1 MAG: FAD synthase [Thermococci archaeon]
MRVLVAGVFDLLHPGHLYFLRRAKEMGRELIVIIARDEIVLKEKGRHPVIPEKQRREMVEGLKPVDRAILGDKEDFLRPVEEINPDLIVLGPNQEVNEDELLKKLRERGMKSKIVRINEKYECELNSSSKIISRVLELFGRD